MRTQIGHVSLLAVTVFLSVAVPVLAFFVCPVPVAHRTHVMTVRACVLLLLCVYVCVCVASSPHTLCVVARCNLHLIYGFQQLGRRVAPIDHTKTTLQGVHAVPMYRGTVVIILCFE